MSDRVVTQNCKCEVRQFFTLLFGDSPNGFIEIRAIDGTVHTQVHFYSRLDDLIDDLANPTKFPEINIYFGVGLRTRRSGKKEDVGQISCLWADIDAKDKETTLDCISQFKPHPSIIVDSGHGFHLYWLLDKPYQILDESNQRIVEGLNKGLAKRLGGDSAFDLGRILRVPHTQNLKDPRNPLPVLIAKIDPNLRYNLKEFQEFWVDPGPNSRNSTKIKPTDIPNRFWRILQQDKNLKATWERNRPDLRDQSRSGYDMALADLLMPYNFSDSEMAAILKASPSGKGKDAVPQYLALTIGKARASWEERKRIASKKIGDTEKGGRQHRSKSKFNPRPYSEEVLANHALKYDRYKRFWIYDENAKIWKNEAEIRLNSILRKRVLGKEDYKRYCVAEIIADLQGLTFIDKQIQEPGAHLIPFKNKIYDVEKDELLDYSPDYFFINKLAVEVNKKNTECPAIDRIFEELVGPEDVITLYEILAYTLYRHYPYPKLFILYGSGANGKTTYIKILGRFLGTDNISLVGVNDLQYNRFASSQLFGKLLNVSGEMDYTLLKNTSKLKQCCGEDLIYCERKFREPFPFVNYAKMVFLTNQVPLTTDKTSAFYRRVFLLEFPNKFILGENADPMLVENIPEQEFEGLAWRCLSQLKGLRDSGFVFTNHPTIQDVAKQYENLSNPLNKFLDENTEKDVNKHIPIGEFNDKYLTYLTNNGLRMWTPKEIGRAMKEKDFEQKSLASRNEDGAPTTVRNWLGLKWK